ncbi:unnamed protein product [Calypogeia fissa]
MEFRALTEPLDNTCFMNELVDMLETSDGTSQGGLWPVIDTLVIGSKGGELVEKDAQLFSYIDVKYFSVWLS